MVYHAKKKWQIENSPSSFVSTSESQVRFYDLLVFSIKEQFAFKTRIKEDTLRVTIRVQYLLFCKVEFIMSSWRYFWPLLRAW